MLHGYRCRNLGTGIRRAKCRTTHLISQRSGKLGSRTRQIFPGQALAMKKNSWIQQPPAASTLPTAVSTLNPTTIKPTLQLQGRASSATSIVVWKPNIQGQVQSFSCFLKILDRNSLLVCSFGDKYLLAIDLNLKTNLLFSVLIYLWRWFSLLLLMVANFFFNPTIGKDGNHLNGAH